MDSKYSADAVAAARSLRIFTVDFPLDNAQTTSDEVHCF
jgi:hypothetical protein